MPTISMFYGIIIQMFINEHNPPHFHAKYQDFVAVFDLDGNIIHGEMPTPQINLIKAWVEIHHDELIANWKLVEEQEPLFRIDPLR